MLRPDDLDDEPTADEARDILFDLLCDLKMRSKLTATDACILAYWAVLSGADGPSLRKLQKAPGDAVTGHYSSHFDRASGLNLSDPNFGVFWMFLYTQLPKAVA